MKWTDKLDFGQEEIFKFLKNERRIHTILPSDDLLFRAFKETPLDTLKLIVIGPFPFWHYSNRNNNGRLLNNPKPYANGLAFSVDTDLESTSANIILLETLPYHTTDSSLLSWAKKGVLLLNRALTCSLNHPSTHIGIWDEFIQSVIDNTDVPVYLIGKEAHHLKVPHHRLWKSEYPNRMNFDNKLPEIFELLELEL